MSGLWSSRVSPRPSVSSSRASESFLLRSSSSTVSFAIAPFFAGTAQDAAGPRASARARPPQRQVSRRDAETNGENFLTPRGLGQVLLRQVRRAVPGERLGEAVRAVTKARDLRGVAGEALQRGGERGDVAVRVEEARLAVADGLAQAGGVAGDGRRAAGGGLDVGDPPPLLRRRLHRRPGGAHQVALALLRHESLERNEVAYAERLGRLP